MAYNLPSSPSRSRRTISPLRSPKRDTPRLASRQASAPTLGLSNGLDVSIAVEDNAGWVSRERVRRALAREDADKREQEREMKVFLQQERRQHRVAIVQSRHSVKEVQAKVNRAALKLERADAEIDRLNMERTRQMERFDRMIEELLQEKQRAEENAAEQVERAQGERVLIFEEQEFVLDQLRKAEHELAELEDSWENDTAGSLSPRPRQRDSLNDSRGSTRGESPSKPPHIRALQLQPQHQASVGSCGTPSYRINLGPSPYPQLVAGTPAQAPAAALPQASFSNVRVANASPTVLPSRVGVPLSASVSAKSLHPNGVPMNAPLTPSAFVGTPVMQPRVLYNTMQVGGGTGGTPAEPIAQTHTATI